MADDDERAAYAQWILERNLDWIGHAEVKAGFIVTLDVAMLAALASVFAAIPAAEREVVANAFAIVTCGLLIAALTCATLCVLPRTGGPEKSFIFFGRVAGLKPADFADKFELATPEILLRDLLDQIHRNAEIACEKFAWVKAAMVWSLLALVAWIPSMALLTKLVVSK